VSATFGSCDPDEADFLLLVTNIRRARGFVQPGAHRVLLFIFNVPNPVRSSAHSRVIVVFQAVQARPEHARSPALVLEDRFLQQRHSKPSLIESKQRVLAPVEAVIWQSSRNDELTKWGPPCCVIFHMVPKNNFTRPGYAFLRSRRDKLPDFAVLYLRIGK